MTLLKTHPTNW